jgi:hypothetical protein
MGAIGFSMIRSGANQKETAGAKIGQPLQDSRSYLMDFGF